MGNAWEGRLAKFVLEVILDYKSQLSDDLFQTTFWIKRNILISFQQKIELIARISLLFTLDNVSCFR